MVHWWHEQEAPRREVSAVNTTKQAAELALALLDSGRATPENLANVRKGQTTALNIGSAHWSMKNDPSLKSAFVSSVKAVTDRQGRVDMSGFIRLIDTIHGGPKAAL